MKTANLWEATKSCLFQLNLTYSARAGFHMQMLARTRARAQKFAVQKHISSLKVDLSCGASPRRAQKHKYCKFRNDRCIIHVSIFHTLPH
jgi:hypothetical protein